VSIHQQPSPGWYPDPAAPGALRWWTGHSWTEHTQAPQQTTPLPYSLDDSTGFTALNLAVPSGRSVATRSLVWGIVSVVIPLFVISGLAIVFGAIGLNRARVRVRHGYDADGRGVAMAGLILGCVSLVEQFVLVAVLGLVRG